LMCCCTNRPLPNKRAEKLFTNRKGNDKNNGRISVDSFNDIYKKYFGN
jgi:hypothetical protein